MTSVPGYIVLEPSPRMSFVLDLCLVPGYKGLRDHDNDPKYTLDAVAYEVHQAINDQPKKEGMFGLAGATVHETRTVYFWETCPPSGELSVQICGGQSRIDRFTPEQMAFWRGNAIWLATRLAAHYGQEVVHIAFSDGTVNRIEMVKKSGPYVPSEPVPATQPGVAMSE